jgi:hypothetical protein
MTINRSSLNLFQEKREVNCCTPITPFHFLSVCGHGWMDRWIDGFKKDLCDWSVVVQTRRLFENTTARPNEKKVKKHVSDSRVPFSHVIFYVLL